MPLTTFPQLTTKRLLLRQTTQFDVDAILFLRSDPAVNQYINRKTPSNRQDATAFFEKVNNHFKEQVTIYWAITLQGTTQMVGSICLWNFSSDRSSAEMGYDLKPDFQGKGIMTEALNCVCDFGFNLLGLVEITAFTHRQNAPSKRLLLKNNFILAPEGVDADNANNILFKRTKDN